jgi:hypothetical protein
MSNKNRAVMACFLSFFAAANLTVAVINLLKVQSPWDVLLPLLGLVVPIPFIVINLMDIKD